ncbi:MAG: hypothetical protein H0X30_14985 [Anaerolineae bacterium]|nr:hypothetical protein [Anaerolineae bacterium]
MKYSRPPVWMVLAFLFITPFVAFTQDGECTTFVKQALAATDKVCTDTGRNEACYGHISLDAQPQAQDTSFKFDAVGDKVDVARVSRLRLSPMDVKTDVWGVALLKVQADIPNNMPGANVSVLVFGDVELENAIPDPVLIDAEVAGPSNANIRRQPSNRAFVISSLVPTTKVKAKGRSKDGAWLYVGLPSGQGSGWVRRSLMKSADDLTTLKELDPSLTSYGPMQAFYLQNGKHQTTCQDVPNDGILIQTPEGVAQVQLWINEVKIKLGSTAFIQASADKKTMSVSTLEGAAHVEALGVEQVAVAGTTVTVRVDENLMPVAPPSLPHAYNMNEVKTLPIQSLERKIIVASPVEVTPTTIPTMTFTPQSNATEPVVSTATDISSVTIEASATAGQTDTVVPATDTVVPPADTSVPPSTNTDVPPPRDTSVPPPPDTAVPPPPDTAVPPPPDTDVPPPPDTSVAPSGQGIQSQNTDVPPAPPAATSDSP